MEQQLVWLLQMIALLALEDTTALWKARQTTPWNVMLATIAQRAQIHPSLMKITPMKLQWEDSVQLALCAHKVLVYRYLVLLGLTTCSLA